LATDSPEKRPDVVLVMSCRVCGRPLSAGIAQATITGDGRLLLTCDHCGSERTYSKKWLDRIGFATMKIKEAMPALPAACPNCGAPRSIDVQDLDSSREILKCGECGATYRLEDW